MSAPEGIVIQFHQGDACISIGNANPWDCGSSSQSSWNNFCRRLFHTLISYVLYTGWIMLKKSFRYCRFVNCLPKQWTKNSNISSKLEFRPFFQTWNRENNIFKPTSEPILNLNYGWSMYPPLGSKVSRDIRTSSLNFALTCYSIIKKIWKLNINVQLSFYLAQSL